jgi:PAS domain S-box-containing protein
MDAIIAIDEGQRIVLFNSAAESMFGCTADKALQTRIDRFIPGCPASAENGGTVHPLR